MSASTSATLAPVLASEMARFTATVLLPTPPLPEATAMTLWMCSNTSLNSSLGSGWGLLVRLISTSASRSTSSWMAAMQSSLIFFFIGQAGVVSTRSKLTFFPSTLMFSIMPNSVRLRPRSGSFTWPRAISICVVVIICRIFLSVYFPNPCPANSVPQSCLRGPPARWRESS